MKLLDPSGQLFYSSRIFGWLASQARAVYIKGRRSFLLPKLPLSSPPTSLRDSVVPLVPVPTNFPSISRAPVAALCFRSLATQEHW